MVVIKRIDKEKLREIKLKNEPFKIWGRMIPSLNNGQWKYEIENFPIEAEDIFPDESYDNLDNNSIIIVAYENDECIGLGILKSDLYRYMYLYDLKVKADRRKEGIGSKIIAEAILEVSKLGYKGIYTIAQDNNLTACLFYLRQGFTIGGFDNRCYEDTKLEGNANIYFYLPVR